MTDHGPTLVHAYPDPIPGPGEALIRMRTAGICATDLELVAGYKGGYRGVMGHEFVGEVIAAPDAPAWVGRRVVGEINIGCGRCDLCRRGLAKHCRTRQSLGIIGRDGVFAELLTLPIANLHVVPDGLSDEQAVFTEPLAAALQIPTQVALTPSMQVAVIGDGRMGLLIAQVMAMSGCDVTVVGHHAEKLALLAPLAIPTRLIGDDSGHEPLAQRALDGRYDLAVEVTGSPAGFALARCLVRPGGTLVLKSTFAEHQVGVNLSDLVVDEIAVLGSRCGPFAPALRLLASGRIQTAALVQARFSLDDGVAALAFAKRRGVLKVLITP